MALRATTTIRRLARALGGDTGDLSGRTVVRLTRGAITAAAVTSQVGGIAVLILLLLFGLPLPDEADGHDALVRFAIAGGGYAAFILPLAVVLGVRAARGLDDWLVEGRRATPAERARTLRFPSALLRMQLAYWTLATVMIVLVMLPVSGTYAFEVGITTVLVGVATSAITFLLTNYASRGVVARLMADEGPQRSEIVRGSTRSLVTWMVGTGVPATGALVLGISSLVLDVESHALARAIVALMITTLVVGFGSTVLIARSVARPLEQLRDALDELDRGNLDVQLPVADISEAGYAQAGFNRAVAGLRERERVRDLFGRHVGEDVARRALEEHVELGGEEREAAALFVDIVGSTAMATRHSATEVVERLNGFFAIVVAVVTEHGGLVNKFEGDAALCIFGAPLTTEDPAGCALAAARDLQERLMREVPDVPAGIGVSAGVVVAGNVGAADRFEYTVIGDPVNEAARLTELAKERDGRIAASEAALRRASADEQAHWVLEDGVVLRGRDAETRIARPARPAVPSEGVGR
jgi:adenylate cyclase